MGEYCSKKKKQALRRNIVIGLVTTLCIAGTAATGGVAAAFIAPVLAAELVIAGVAAGGAAGAAGAGAVAGGRRLARIIRARHRQRAQGQQFNDETEALIAESDDDEAVDDV